VSGLIKVEFPPTSRAILFQSTLKTLLMAGKRGPATALVRWFLHAENEAAGQLRSDMLVWAALFRALARAKSEGDSSWKPRFAQCVAAFCKRFEHERRTGESSIVGRRFGIRGRRFRIVRGFGHYSMPHPAGLYALRAMTTRPDLLSAPNALKIVKLIRQWNLPVSDSLSLALLSIFAQAGDAPQAQIWYRQLKHPRFRRRKTKSRARVMRLMSLRRHPAKALVFHHVIEGELDQSDTHVANMLLLDITGGWQKIERPQWLQIACAFDGSQLPPAVRARSVYLLMRGFAERKQPGQVIACWQQHALALDAPSSSCLRLLAEALVESNQFEKALDAVRWYGGDQARYARAPQYCQPSAKPVAISPRIANTLLQGLAEPCRWQDFWKLWQELTSGAISSNTVLNSASIVLLLHSGSKASIQNGRGGDNAFSRAAWRAPPRTLQEDTWDGAPAWKQAIEVAWSRLGHTWCQAGGTDEELRKLRAPSFFSRLSFDQLPFQPKFPEPKPFDLESALAAAEATNERPVDLDSDAYRHLIRTLALFSRAHDIWPVLYCQKTLAPSQHWPSRRDAAAAVMLVEESGATRKTVVALEKWLADWLGRDRVPLEHEKAKALRELTKTYGPRRSQH
jgi:hypothetical protein